MATGLRAPSRTQFCGNCDCWIAAERSFRRHFRPIAILAIVAAIIGVGALSSSGGTPVAGGTASSRAAVVATPDAVDSANGSSTSDASASRSAPTKAVAGAGGKTYSCDAAAAAALDEMEAELNRGRGRNRGLDRQIKAIDRLYPGQTAPSDVVARYNALVNRYNAQVRRRP